MFYAFSFLSCFENEQEKKDVVVKNQYLNQNSVTVLISKAHWDGKVGEEIREKFAAPIMGLHDCESVFALLPVHANTLSSQAKASRNILVVSTDFTSETIHEKDKYAKNQNVFTIHGKNEKEILNQIHGFSKKIIDTFYNSEISALQQKSKVNKNLQKQIKKQFLVDMKNSYRIPKRIASGKLFMVAKRNWFGL